MHRGEFFEDPLGEELQRASLGEVTGGGTMQNQNGEIASCDIEIELAKPNPQAAEKFSNALVLRKGVKTQDRSGEP
jgi:hypothetical protein